MLNTVKKGMGRAVQGTWRAVAALALVGGISGTLSSGAWAQSTHSCSHYSSCLGADNSTLKSSETQNTILTQPFAITNALTSRMSGSSDGGPFALNGMGTGTAAAAVGRTSNIWLSYGNTRAANSEVNGNYGATINNYTAGYDYAWSPNLVFGVSIAYSDSRVSTYFNNGRFDTKGYVVAPYLSYQLSKNWSADVSAGWGRGDQTTAAFNTSANGKIDRSFAAANLNGVYWFGRHQFGTRFTVLNGVEKINNFTLGGTFVPETKNKLTQVQAMARYGYWFDGVMPYVSLALSSDVERTTNPVFEAPGRNAWIPKIGVDFFSKRGITGGISYSSEQGRSSVKNDVWAATVSFRF